MFPDETPGASSFWNVLGHMRQHEAGILGYGILKIAAIIMVDLGRHVFRHTLLNWIATHCAVAIYRKTDLAITPPFRVKLWYTSIKSGAGPKNTPSARKRCRPRLNNRQHCLDNLEICVKIRCCACVKKGGDIRGSRTAAFR